MSNRLNGLTSSEHTHLNPDIPRKVLYDDVYSS